jgi:ribosomal protein L19E
MSDVGETISSHSARKTTAQDKSGLKKGKGRRKGGSKPKQPRARENDTK